MTLNLLCKKNGFVKIEDTVYDTAGDQFWARNEFIIKHKGKAFVIKKQLFSFIKLYYKKIRRKLLN
jgi:hypothetical protein